MWLWLAVQSRTTTNQIFKHISRLVFLSICVYRLDGIHTHTNNSDKITRLSYINNHTRSFVVLFVPFSFSVDFEPFVISIHNDVLKKRTTKKKTAAALCMNRVESPFRALSFTISIPFHPIKHHTAHRSFKFLLGGVHRFVFIYVNVV